MTGIDLFQRGIVVLYYSNWENRILNVIDSQNTTPFKKDVLFTFPTELYVDFKGFEHLFSFVKNQNNYHAMLHKKNCIFPFCFVDLLYAEQTVCLYEISTTVWLI